MGKNTSEAQTFRFVGPYPTIGTSYGESTSRVLAAVANRMEATALAVGMSALRQFKESELARCEARLESGAW